MFSWLGTDDRRKKEPEVFQTVSDGLKKLYKTKLLPLEESYKFHEFHSPALEDADFDNKPMVLLVGQYSTGKTSFIRWEKRPLHVKGNKANGEIERERLTHPNWLDLLSLCLFLSLSQWSSLSYSCSKYNWHAKQCSGLEHKKNTVDIKWGRVTRWCSRHNNTHSQPDCWEPL